MEYENLATTVVDRFRREACGLPVSRIFNSIGSMIHCGFGDSHPEMLPTGEVYQQQDHAVLLSMTAWRIMHHKQYVVGAYDTRENIKQKILLLADKRLLGVEVASSFLDLRICFEDEFTLSTFMYDLSERQWLLFAGEWSTRVGSDLTVERERLRLSDSTIPVRNHYKRITTLVDRQTIHHVTFDDDSIILAMSKELSIIIDIWCWRLEKGDQCVVVSGEDEVAKTRALELLRGCSVDYIEVADQMMETRFHIGEYVLSTFVCSQEAMTGWGIYDGKNRPLALYPPESE